MDKRLKMASFLANLLDSRFKVGKYSFGIDPILGLIPGGGDLISLAISLYIVYLAVQMKLPTIKILQMLLNVGIDTIIGVIPFFGDLFDIGFKANMRNLKIIKTYS
jgi:hypothetical protein